MFEQLRGKLCRKMQSEQKVSQKLTQKNSIQTKSITLVLTHQCNLRCIYCYEKHKDDRTMSLELAKKILDYELTLDDGIPEAEIDLFGGEPLLEFDTVRDLIEYAKTRSYPKNYIFFITTNGILLDESRKAWLRENTDYLQMGLSLDGTREMHNINRCNSFDKIDLDFFRNTYPDQLVKMTISDKTLKTLSEGVIFCHQQGFGVSCNLAYGIDWSSEENKSVLEEQLMKLIEFYLAHPDIKPCAMLDINRLKSMSQITDRSVRYCGAGYAMKAYDNDGKFYPCQHFLPLSIGKDMADASLKIDFSKYELDDGDLTRECRECVIRNVCPTCYGENYSSTGNIHLRDGNMCKLFKIQFKALAYFVSELFRLDRLTGYTKAEIASLLKSSLLINQSISS